MPRIRVMGIDPGLRNCGVAVLDGREAAIAQAVVLSTDTGMRLRDRVRVIATGLWEMMETWRPDIVVTESPSFPQGKRAAVMVWSSYATIEALCLGRARIVTRSPREWRRMLELPECGVTDETRSKAQRRRKASTKAWVLRRYPGLERLLAPLARGLHEHAYDAVAIASTFVDAASAGLDVHDATDYADEEANE